MARTFCRNRGMHNGPVLINLIGNRPTNIVTPTSGILLVLSLIAAAIAVMIGY
jgi:hypothetical protein